MGLRQSAYFTAWLLSAYVRVFVGSVLFVFLPLMIHSSADQIIKYCDDYRNYNLCPRYPIGWWEMYINNDASAFLLSYFLYFLASVHQALALSALFSEPKLAGELGTFITTLSTLLSYLIFSSKCYESETFFYIISILPQPSIAFAYISVST